MMSDLDDLAVKLVGELRTQKLKIVFAESCTGGLVAATLTRIPGVSDCFCGSAVTYLDEVKIRWLGVAPQAIAAATAVSNEVACEMACGVLKITKESGLSAAITGHLGPDAPDGLDGIVYIAIAFAQQTCKSEVISRRFTLSSEGRTGRQTEATALLISFVCEQIHRLSD